jgi:glyoxylase-like metal-dependent hydrolase (beta-lactamase superfamily II)
MLAVTGVQQRAAWLTDAVPEAEQIRDSVWSIPIPAESLTVHYTLCYLLLDKNGGGIIVDPGWDSDVGWERLEAGLRLAGLPLERLDGIVVTHAHADHLGLAGRLVDASGAWLGWHEAEKETLIARRDSPAARERFRSWLTYCGVPENADPPIVVTPGVADALNRLRDPTRLLRDGQSLPLEGRRVHVVRTPGHTSGHLCVVDTDEKLILTGDHVLPKISPNIGEYDTEGRGIIAKYLESLNHLRQWDGFEVAPGHEYRFLGLGDRLDDLLAHHATRTDETKAILAGSPDGSVWEVANQLTWSRGWDNLNGPNRRLALAQTLGQFVYLRDRGVAGLRVDDAGVARAALV